VDSTQSVSRLLGYQGNASVWQERGVVAWSPQVWKRRILLDSAVKSSEKPWYNAHLAITPVCFWPSCTIHLNLLSALCLRGRVPAADTMPTQVSMPKLACHAAPCPCSACISPASVQVMLPHALHEHSNSTYHEHQMLRSHHCKHLLDEAVCGHRLVCVFIFCSKLVFPPPPTSKLTLSFHKTFSLCMDQGLPEVSPSDILSCHGRQW